MPRKRLLVARRAAYLLHRPPGPHDERPTRVAAAVHGHLRLVGELPENVADRGRPHFLIDGDARQISFPVPEERALAHNQWIVRRAGKALEHLDEGPLEPAVRCQRDPARLQVLSLLAGERDVVADEAIVRLYREASQPRDLLRREAGIAGQEHDSAVARRVARLCAGREELSDLPLAECSLYGPILRHRGSPSQTRSWNTSICSRFVHLPPGPSLGQGSTRSRMLKDTEPARAGVRADRALHRHHGR